MNSNKNKQKNAVVQNDLQNTVESARFSEEGGTVNSEWTVTVRGGWRHAHDQRDHGKVTQAISSWSDHRRELLRANGELGRKRQEMRLFMQFWWVSLSLSVHTCTCVKNRGRCKVSSFITLNLFYLFRVSHWTWSTCICLEHLASIFWEPLISTSRAPGVDVLALYLTLYVSSADMNSGSHVCMESSLLAEP